MTITTVLCGLCGKSNPSRQHYCLGCGSDLRAQITPDDGPTATLISDPTSRPIGSVLAERYRIVELLGRGGMGEVYRALDLKLDEDVALKFINPNIASEPGAIERFRNELKLARKITHRTVCRMFDLNESEGRLFISMEYVAGEDVRSRIQSEGRLTADEAVGIGLQVCEGLCEAHRLGIIHRDLKPANIFLDRSGQVKIMDFGLALAVGAGHLTQSGLMVGTPIYMSPEQLACRPLDARSDIYSLGIVLYEMLVGRPPFKGSSALTIAIKHQSEAPRDPHKVDPGIPEELSRIILTCLEKDPDKRFQSIADVKKALEGVTGSWASVKARMATPSAAQAVLVLILAALAVAAGRLHIRAWSRAWIERASLPLAFRLARGGEYFRSWIVGREIEAMNPHNRRLGSLWSSISRWADLETSPSGALVSVGYQGCSAEAWQTIGSTPIRHFRFPRGDLQLRLSRKGFASRLTSSLAWDGTSRFLLLTEGNPTITNGGFRIVEVHIGPKGTEVGVQADLGDGAEKGLPGSIRRPRGGSDPRPEVVSGCSLIEFGPDAARFKVDDPKAAVRFGDIVVLNKSASVIAVSFVTDPPGATIAVDYGPGNFASAIRNLKAGRHQVLVQKAGYRDIIADITVAEEPEKQEFRYQLVAQSPTKGTLIVTSEPPGAQVYLGGAREPAGVTPLERELNPQAMDLRGSLDGYRDSASRVVLRAGETTRCRLVLEPFLESVEIGSNPVGAQVFLDQAQSPAGMTPFRVALPPGKHHVRLSMSGMKDSETELTIIPGERAEPLLVRLAKEPLYRLTVASDPSGASVVVNGRVQPLPTPLEATLSESRVDLTVSKTGYKPRSDSFELGQEKTLKNYALEPLGQATLTITSNPSASVQLDGSDLEGIVPPQKTVTILEGEHILRFTFAKTLVWEEKITVQKGDRRVVHGSLDRITDLGVYALGAFPRASLDVDGKDIGPIPPLGPMRIREGRHKIAFSFEEKNALCRSVTILDRIRKGQKRTIHVSYQRLPLDRSAAGLPSEIASGEWLWFQATLPLSGQVDGLSLVQQGPKLLGPLKEKGGHCLDIVLDDQDNSGQLEARIYDLEGGETFVIRGIFSSEPVSENRETKKEAQ